MLGAFDRIGTVEAGIGEVVAQPVLLADVQRAAGRSPPGRDRRLGGGDRHAGDGDAVALGQHLGGGAIAAADVADRLAGAQAQTLGHQPDQRLGGLCRGLLPGCPVAVMDVLAPDVAVEGVQLVIMVRDGG